MSVTPGIDAVSDYIESPLCLSAGSDEPDYGDASGRPITRYSYEYDDNGNRVDAGYTNHGIWEVTAYWDANAGASTTVVDSSTNEIDLEMVEDVAWSDASLPPVPGNEYVLAFDGSGDHLTSDSPGSAALKIGSGDFSIALWIKPDSESTQRMAIAAHGNPEGFGGKGFELSYLPGSTGKPLVAFLNNGSGNAQQVSFNTYGLLQNGSWHHVALTIDRDGQIRMGRTPCPTILPPITN